MNRLAYIWNGTEALPVVCDDLMDRRRYLAQFVLHTFISGAGRYGRFCPDTTVWENLPIEAFPAEFRTHLLLLGVA